MPIYEYLCSQCHQISDALQKVSDPAPDVCPQCGAQNSLSRQVSRTSFVLKGGGWYADLYGSSKEKKIDSGKPETKPESKADSGTGSAAAGDSGGSGASSSGGSGSSGGGGGSGDGGSKVAAASGKS